jgi:hypothetical protein
MTMRLVCAEEVMILVQFENISSLAPLATIPN